eukprot:gene17012-18725_t
MAAKLDHVRLSNTETLIHWGTWLPCVPLPFWHMYQTSNKYFPQLHSAFFDSTNEAALLTGRSKDVSDGEWTFWRQFFFAYTCVCIISSLLCNAMRPVSLLARKISLITVSFIALAAILGTRGLAFLLLYSCSVYIMSRTKIVALIWTFVLTATYAINYEPFQSEIVAKVADNDTAQSLFVFSAMMSNLRLLSFALEYAKHNEDTARNPSPNIIDFLAFVFYFPLFLNGPILTFDKFNTQMRHSVEKPILVSLCLEVLSCLLYFVLIEISYHLFYSASISKHTYILEELSCWETLGIIWTQLQFFYVKYVVFYRFAGVFVQIDGMQPPGQPGCISNLYTFVDMWRYFDKGLYAFLKRYIYIPIGGSRSGLFRQILASFMCFAFVGYWHGGNERYFTWAITNWLGVTLEGIVTVVVSSKIVTTLRERIGARWYRRICAAFGSVTVIVIILSNMVFLTGVEATRIYIDRLFVNGCPWCATGLVVALYCAVQCIIDARLA